MSNKISDQETQVTWEYGYDTDGTNLYVSAEGGGVLSDELVDLIARKSKEKKLFFSKHKGRKQMSMLLDDDSEAEGLVNTLGGKVGRKLRSKPIGALEWYYHGPKILDVCEQVMPRLNYFQQNLVAGWITEGK